MKKLVYLLTAGVLCASCLFVAGCGSDEAVESETDSAVADIIAELNPVGSYTFDSIALETAEGDITAAGVGADWEGQTLDENYATAEMSEDGTLVISGALEAEGTWAFDADGFFGVELDLSEGEVTGAGIDSDGIFSLDITFEDGTILYYTFIR